MGKHGVTFYTPPAALEDIRTAIITQGVSGLVVSLLTLVATIYDLIGYYKKKHSSTSEALVKIWGYCFAFYHGWVSTSIALTIFNFSRAI